MPKAADRQKRSYGDVLHLLAKDACVLCSLLKRFQSACIQGANAKHVQTLCDFHAWAIAGATNTEAAAQIFLQLLDRSQLQEGAAAKHCSLCDQIAQEEIKCSQEFVLLLEDAEFRDWLREHGAMCIPHARRLLTRVPKEEREVVVALARDGVARLRNSLASGAGEPDDRRLPALLSLAAEYLEGRRGLALKD